MANENKQATPLRKLEGVGHLTEQARTADVGPESLKDAREKGYLGVVPDDNDYSLGAVTRENFDGPMKQPRSAGK